MARKTMDKGEDAKGHLAEGEKSLLLVAAMLTGLSALLFVTAFDPNDVGSSAVFASFVVFIAGISLAIGTLSYAKAMKRIPWFVSVGILFFSAIGLYCGIGFRDGLAPAQIMQAFIIVGFAVLLMVAARQCAQKWLNYRFSQESGNNRIEHEGTQHSVEAVFWVGIILVAFGALAYLFLPTAAHLFKPLANEDKNWLTLTTIVLAAAGLVTYWWAAKGNFIKSVQTDEMIAAGKRDEMKNTAQLIADSSAMLSKSDPEKSAGLAFLNQVASDKNGLFSREAYEVILDFCDADEDISPTNKHRTRALGYASKIMQEVYGNRRYGNEPELAIKGSKQDTYQHTAFFQIVRKYSSCTIFLKEIDGANFECEDVYIRRCTLKNPRISGKVEFHRCRIIDMNVGDVFPTTKGDPRFQGCDFSGCCLFSIDKSKLTAENFVGCYYYADDPPSDDVLRTLEGLIEEQPDSQRSNVGLPGAW